MQYLIAFLEGIITFLSPCLLPMLPIYISYFAGGDRKNNPLLCALGFVLGFTVVFTAMGALAGTVGAFLRQYQRWVDLVTGLIVIFFGLHYLGVLRLQLFRGGTSIRSPGRLGFFSAIVFGMVFSLGWTPCVGVFLGSALMLASQQAHVLAGVSMLLCYCAGLGIPFLLSAVLIDRLRGTFAFIKNHYRIINLVCGSFLCLVGILMVTGTLGWLLALLGGSL